MYVEVTRVQDHIAGAEALLRARATDDLSPLQRLVRRLLREELAAYRERGCFPKNRDFPDGRRPYFVDADGTRCAMAHLMEVGGAGALVAEIKATNNNAYVSELAADERFLAWLDAAGLTVEEAGRIQPAYACAPPQNCLCMDNAESATVWEGTVVARAAETPTKVRIDVVHGASGLVSVGDEIEVLTWSTGERILGTASRDEAGGSTGGIRFELVAPIDEGDVLGALCLRPSALDTETLPDPLGPLPTSLAASLVTSPAESCKAELAKIDACWASDRCSGVRKGEPPPPRCVRPAAGQSDAGAALASPSDDGSAPNGCNAGAGAPVTSTAVLLAILGVLAARRRRGN